MFIGLEYAGVMVRHIRQLIYIFCFIFLCHLSSAWADARTRALSETYLPDLIKINHSPSSPLAHMDAERFFNTNALIVAYCITQFAQAQNAASRPYLRDPL